MGSTNSEMVVVTGAAGFIGSRLSEKLIELGYRVVGVDHLDHFQERKYLSTIKFSKTIDMKDCFSFLATPEGQATNALFHLGACTDTTEFDRDFLDEVNTQYSKKIWESCTRLKIPLIYASSAATYGDGVQGYSDDEEKIESLKPLNPYGDSKQEFDVWVLDQEKKNSTPPAWSGFKFFNVYGYREEHKGSMASVVLKGFEQIKAENKIRLFKSHKSDVADGQQQRDFIFVDDVVDILLFAFDKPIQRGIYNCGTGKARSFLDLALATFEALGIEPHIEFIPTPEEIRDRYQYYTQAEMNKVRAQGYDRPFTELEAGVKKTVSWLNR